jgi:cold shock CspA family protein
MRTGTVSDFDFGGLFGLIDADDGRLLLFNLAAAPSGLRQRFRIGTRVTFELESTRSDWAASPLPIGAADPGEGGLGELPGRRGFGGR